MSATPGAKPAPRLREFFVRYFFLMVIAVNFGFFAAYNPNFLLPENLVNILEGSAILLILALGMTLVVAMGGIDLSVGVAMDFGAAFAVVALKNFGVPWYAAVGVGIGGGALVGLLNALLVVRFSVSPFMATLGTFFIGSSMQRVFTDGGGPISFRKMPQQYRDLGVGELFGIPTEIIIAVFFCIVYYVLLQRSIFGKRVYAAGLQPSAAKVAGIRVGKYLFIGFVAASATCAVGGLIASANIRMFTPLAGFSYLLDAIAAVFIGASLHPLGRPNVIGTLIGVLFLGMVANGLNLMGLDFNLKDALSGIILVAALAIATWQRKLLGNTG